jgi:iron complex transport system substrate-binding protein
LPLASRNALLLALLKGEESRIVALSTFADNPKYSFITEIPKSVKARVGDNIESLLVLKPDLVIVASYTAAEITEQLKAAKVNVQVQKSFAGVKDIEDNIKEIGRLIGKDKEAQAMIANMEKTMDAAIGKQPKCKRRPTLLQYASSDILPGTETIIDDVAERAGYHNVLRDIAFKGWRPISGEILAQQKPDLIIASAADAASKEELIAKMKKSSGWQKLDAVQKGKVILIPDRLLYTVSYHVAELVAFLAEQLAC